MAESAVYVVPFPRNSISRSNALLAPLAGAEFFTILASDLPSGYYSFKTTVAISPNAGSGNGNVADTRNFRIAVEGFPEYIPQAVLNNGIISEGFINLNGSQSVIAKVGNVAASANMIYSISIFMTKLSS